LTRAALPLRAAVKRCRTVLPDVFRAGLFRAGFFPGNFFRFRAAFFPASFFRTMVPRPICPV
jgi:hypothetical protein